MPDLRQVIFILKDAWNLASKGTIVNWKTGYCLICIYLSVLLFIFDWLGIIEEEHDNEESVAKTILEKKKRFISSVK